MTETRIAAGSWSAVVDDRGCTLRDVEHEGRSLLSSPPEFDPSRGHHGAVLAPWPGRTVGAGYRFEGVERELAITEPTYGHALHGFVFDSTWIRASADAEAVTHETVLGGQPGYPSKVCVRVTYRVDGSGLHCTSEWSNIGHDNAPFGIGFHPYLAVSESTIDDWTLELAANISCDSDPATKRALPVRTTTLVDDFIEARRIGSARFSRAYGDIRRQDGLAVARITAPDGFAIELGVDAGFRWLQVFTADLGSSSLARRGIAIEPQTCPPDAFNSGRDLQVLLPGEQGRAGWFLRRAH